MKKDLQTPPPGSIVYMAGAELRWPLFSGIEVVVENAWDWVVFCDIFVNREYPLYIRRKEGHKAHIIDLGANVGYFSLFVADLMEREKQEYMIYAFEANPETYKILLKRTESQRLFNIQNFHGAIGKKKGSTRIGLSANHSTSMLTEDETISAKVKYLDVDNYVPPTGRIDIIKCDIEGAEYDFVNNYPDLLRRTDVVFMEIHKDNGTPEDLKNVMLEYGFKYHLLVDKETAETGMFYR